MIFRNRHKMLIIFFRENVKSMLQIFNKYLSKINRLKS
jgi:hypothetical protein